MNTNPYIPAILESFLKTYGDRFLPEIKPKFTTSELNFYHNSIVQRCIYKTIPVILDSSMILNSKEKQYSLLVIKLPLYVEDKITSVDFVKKFFTNLFKNQEFDMEMGFTFYHGIILTVKRKNVPYTIKFIFEKKYNKQEKFSLIL